MTGITSAKSAIKDQYSNCLDLPICGSNPPETLNFPMEQSP